MDKYKQEKNILVLFISCYMSYLLIHWFACFFVVFFFLEIHLFSYLLKRIVCQVVLAGVMYHQPLSQHRRPGS